MGDGKRTPHVVKRPARATTPISAPKLAELVEDLRTPEPDAAATFELPAADDDENIVELTVDDDPPPAKPTRNAHVVRRPK